MGDGLSLVAVTVVATALRLVRLADPAAFVFDETYYAKDACWYVVATRATCKIGGEQTGVHPPLGKWLVGVGIELFGYDSFGWRIIPAVAGSLSVALLYLLARRILGSTVGALVSAGLLAVDPLHFVQSRVAMLDIFVCLAGVAAFLFAILDRDYLGRDGRKTFSARPYRAAAGVAAGMGLAAKWSGGLLLIGLIVLSVAWEVAAAREAYRVRSSLAAGFGSIALWLLGAPLVVYVLSYAGRIHGRLVGVPWADGSWLKALWDQQKTMLAFHSGLTDTHSYQSPPWSWPLLKRPVSYFFDTTAAGDYKEVLATGSPWVWWASLAALIVVLLRWARRRDYLGPEGVILTGFSFAYLPWLVLAGDRPAVFLFYLLPAVPFMCLALGYMAARMWRSRGGRTGVVFFIVGAVTVFVYYYPFLANVAIPEKDWRTRIWIFDNCDKPPPEQVLSTITESSEGRTLVRTVTSNEGDDLPPEGWCWI
jgi:dolichyl-phosphate-mannose-protein mannosyltransferase